MLASGLYLPMWGLSSPEPDLSGNANNGTLTGTSYADHPPVTGYTKKKSTVFLSTPAPPGPPVASELFVNQAIKLASTY